MRAGASARFSHVFPELRAGQRQYDEIVGTLTHFCFSFHQNERNFCTNSGWAVAADFQHPLAAGDP